MFDFVAPGEIQFRRSESYNNPESKVRIRRWWGTVATCDNWCILRCCWWLCVYCRRRGKQYGWVCRRLVQSAFPKNSTTTLSFWPITLSSPTIMSTPPPPFPLGYALPFYFLLLNLIESSFDIFNWIFVMIEYFRYSKLQDYKLEEMLPFNCYP